MADQHYHRYLIAFSAARAGASMELSHFFSFLVRDDPRTELFATDMQVAVALGIQDGKEGRRPRGRADFEKEHAAMSALHG